MPPTRLGMGAQAATFKTVFVISDAGDNDKN